MKIIFYVLILFIGINLNAQENSELIKVGDKAPDFIIKGKSIELNKDQLEGKIVLLNFFATWCPPCRKELPILENKVWNKYKDHPKFELFVIGRNHSEDELDAFSKGKYILPFYPDPNRDIYRKFADNTIPRNYIIDDKGTVIYASIGYSDEEFEKMLEVLESKLKN